MFCACDASFGGEPNSRTCPVCLGLPGVLPVLNRRAVELATRLALALHCEIASYSIFHRKNYFYPDMPKNFQISQYDLPLGVGGYLDLELDGEAFRVGITRVHLEEDTGKTVHVSESGRIHGSEYSLEDFNRAGVPLLEIVTEPDIRTPEQARAFMQELKSIMEHLEVSDCRMEEGSLRCDANVSLRPVGSGELGVKTEVKNMNSFRFVEKALQYEIDRQRAVLEDGGTIVQETRLWDASRGVTVGMRGKEEAHDYRYFPDPDLVPVVPDPAWVEEIRRSLPELPDEKEARFVRQYGLAWQEAKVLTSSAELADFFEKTVQRFPKPKAVSNWMLSELLRELRRQDLEIDACPVTPDSLAAMLAMIEDGTISGKIGKQVFEEMMRSGAAPEAIVREKGWVQIQDESEIASVVDKVLGEHPEEVAAFRKGKEKLLAFFVGQVMKATRGKASPKVVNDLLLRRLKSGS